MSATSSLEKLQSSSGGGGGPPSHKPIKKVQGMGKVSNNGHGPMPLQKIVLLPAQSLGHSRQNSSGSVGGIQTNSSLATYQDSLNSFGLMGNSQTVIQNNKGQPINTGLPNGQVHTQLFFGKSIPNSQPQSCIVSARGTEAIPQTLMNTASANASVTSSTENLLKPGVPLQTRGMLSAQQTAEKQKPVFFHHFKKNSIDSQGTTVKGKTLFVNSQIHQRNSSGSSSSGGSSGRDSKPPMPNNNTSELIHIQKQKPPMMIPPSYHHHHHNSAQVNHSSNHQQYQAPQHIAAQSQITQQQLKMQKYKKMKNELVTSSTVNTVSSGSVKRLPLSGSLGPSTSSQGNLNNLARENMMKKTLLDTASSGGKNHSSHNSLHGHISGSVEGSTPSFMQSALYQKVSGQVKSSPSTNNDSQTKQVKSNPSSVLKTAAMTKNLLLANQKENNALAGNNNANQKSVNENQAKAQTLKLQVNNLLQKPNSQTTASGGEISSRTIPKPNQQVLHKPAMQQSQSRQVVNFNSNGGTANSNQSSGGGTGLIPNDSLKNNSSTLAILTNQKNQYQNVATSMHAQVFQQKPQQLGSKQQPTANQQTTSALTSSKMMMALHKKCNSISTTPIASQGLLQQFLFQHNTKPNQQDSAPQRVKKEDVLVTLSDEGLESNNRQSSFEIAQSTVRHSNMPSQINLQQQQVLSSGSTIMMQTLATSQMSCQQQSTEFMDENVQVNQIRQITPRGQVGPGSQQENVMINYNTSKMNNQLQVHNFFDRPQPIKKCQDPIIQRGYIPSGSISAGVTSPVHHPNKENFASNIRSDGPSTHILHHQAQPYHKRIISLIPETLDEDLQLDVNVAASKRRSCYEQKRQSLSNNQRAVAQQSLERIMKEQTTPKNIKKDEMALKLAQAHEEFSNRKKNEENQQDAKEDIVQSIGLILRQQKGLSIKEVDLVNDPTHKLTLQHLRDFLTYLEDKGIINCQTLAKDEHEMQNLIKDLVKLDFNKFQTPTMMPSPQVINQDIQINNNIQASQIKNKRLSSDANTQNRRVSLDQMKNQKQVFVISPNDDHEVNMLSPSQNASNLPSAQKNRQQIKEEENGVLCFYSPINVNGSGNIVNTNIQIYQPAVSSSVQGTKQVLGQLPRSQHLGQRVFSQPVSSEKDHQVAAQFNQQHDKIVKVRGPFQQLFQQPNNHVNVPSFQQNQQNHQQLQSNDPNLIILAPQQQKRQHKRVYSIGSNEQIVANQRGVIMENQQQPHMNFGFGFQQVHQNNQMMRRHSNGKSEVDNHQIKQQIAVNVNQNQINLNNDKIYHARKRSMFVQQPYQENQEALMDQQILQPQIRYNQFFNAQHQRSQEVAIQGLDSEKQFQDDICVDPIIVPIQQQKPNHRRAATNFVQSTAYQEEIRTLQPIPDQYFTSRGGSVESLVSLTELAEDREKLIAYIKHFTFSIRPEIPVTSVDYYKFIKLIGKGAFGKVTLGIHKLTGKQVAIKTVDKTLMKDDYQKKKVLQEVQILKKVRHGNVIRLLEVFESPKHLLMVMEYAGGGDLLQYVKKHRRLDETEGRRIFKQVVYGIAHCHCRSVLHRDIKLDNILLDNEGDIKICDFGVSRVISKHQRISEQCGTPAYIAPEIISDGGYQGFAADIWSLGVLLFAMLCGTVPFKAQSMHELHELIINGKYDYPQQNVNVSNEAKDLIGRMLVVNPKDRISISEILKHPWIQLFESILDENQDYQMDSDITLHSFDAQGAAAYVNSNNTHPGQAPQLNINEILSNVNVDNLYKDGLASKQRLSYSDYCSITQDYATMHLNDDVMQKMESTMGITKKLVREHLNRGDLNHATATYQLMVLS